MFSKNFNFLFLFVLLLYLFFPTTNSSMDAYAYAGYVKYNLSLFTPHHLLYNPFIYVLKTIFETLHPALRILEFSKAINSIFAVINLIILKDILKLQGLKTKDIVWYVLLVAFSFSLWRYGTENETYILPSTFSLLGSFYFLKFSKTENTLPLFLSGLFLTIACLFHQLAILWWLGILIGSYIKSRSIPKTLLYSVSFIIVPVVYILVIRFYEHQPISTESILSYILHDFQQGTADPKITGKGVLFLIISTIRTFIQIHPNIYLLLQKSILYSIPLLVAFYALYQFMVTLSKRQLLVKLKNDNLLFIKTHLYIGIATLIFALLIAGNIEFMTTLPYLLVLSVTSIYKINTIFLKTCVFTLLIWNGSYGIVPNHFYSNYNDTILLNHMITHPENTYIINNYFLKNQYFYETGVNNPNRIQVYKNLDKTQVIELLKKEQCIYTDIIDKPKIVNRESFFSDESIALFLNDFDKTELFTFKGLYGTSTLHKICK